ncbi:MAG TPA: T9SS type A sorting domain-containing protein, partial [Candidatus Kapabacteria bacterium]|nr:T9SS type A sorting domain-containing protein [Candidatus Kapabacteria bacterium]
VTMSVAGVAPTRTSFSVHAGKLSVSNSTPITGKLQIVDVIGRTVMALDLSSQQSVSVDINGLVTGSYFVTLDSEGKRETYRFQR